MDRTRLRGWLALGLLGLGAVVAACSEEFTGLKRLLPTDPSRHEVWPASNPPYQCRIGLKTTNLQTLSGIPTVDTVCSTIVTMSWPAFQDPAIPQQEHTFWWLHSEPGPWPPKVTGYGTGSFNDKLNGPITYTFSRKISRFSIHNSRRTGTRSRLTTWRRSIQQALGSTLYRLDLGRGPSKAIFASSRILCRG